MPTLPTNMIRRTDRPGYWFQSKTGGKRVRKFLSLDFREACRLLKRYLDRRLPADLTVSQAAKQWLEGYVATVRSPQNRALAKRRSEMYLKRLKGHVLLNRLETEDLRRNRLWLEKKELPVQSVAHLLSDVGSFDSIAVP